MHTTADLHPEIRDAIRDLCRQFPDEYFRAGRRRSAATPTTSSTR
jgi:hypothetical protein